jgi:pyroglutamyl-peptidase
MDPRTDPFGPLPKIGPIRSFAELVKAARADGKLTKDELDQLMLKARDGKGLDPQELEALRGLLALDRKELDDDTRARLLQYLGAMAQTHAWVNVEVAGQVERIESRFAALTTNVPGLSARLGLFDSTFSLIGPAQADGTLNVRIEGQQVSVAVAKGDTAATIFEKLKGGLPAGVTALTFGGDVRPYDPFKGKPVNPQAAAAHLTLYKPGELGLKPGETPLRVVVTGFGPFGDVVDNPSARMAEKVAEHGAPGAVVECRILAVTTGAVDDFMREMKESKPDVVLSMGKGSHTQIEASPSNRLAKGTDGAGQEIQSRPVVPGGPKSLRTDLPPAGALLKGGAQIAISNKETRDTSGYLCNYLGYSLAYTFGDKADPEKRTTAGFVHMEATAPEETMQKLAESVTANQLELRRSGYAH